MNKLLIARSRHDSCNEYLYAYSEELITFAMSRGWKVELADDSENTKPNIAARLSNRPSLVVLNGHGSAEEVYGFDDVNTLDNATSF